MKRVVISVLALFLLLTASLAAYSYLSPRFVLDDIRKASRAGDKERLRDLIEFESVRSGLKEDIKAGMLLAVKNKLEGNPFAALGLAMVSLMVDPMVDAMVSPSGLVAMLESGKPTAKTDRDDAATTRGETTQENLLVEQGYEDFSRYRIRIRPIDSPDQQPLTLTLRRDGLFSWKLTRISMPFPGDLVNDTPGRNPRREVRRSALREGARSQPPAAPPQFVVPLGVFSNPRAKTALLEANDIPYYIEDVGSNLARVRAGPFASESEAQVARDRARSLGFDPGFVRSLAER